MSQFGVRGHPAGIQMTPAGGRGQSARPAHPEDSAYLQPTVGPTGGYASSGASTGSIGGRTLNEYDSGVADVDGINLNEKNDNYIKAQRSPPVLQTKPEGRSFGGPTPGTPSQSRPAPPATLQVPQQAGIMKRPDSLARNHEYEELPSGRYHNPAEYSYTDMDSNVSQPRTPAAERLMVSTNGSQSGASGDSRELYCDSNHNDRPPSTYRKRENPLYDSADHVRQPSIEDKPKVSLCSCPYILIIFFSLVSLCAFILAALAISGLGGSVKREAALVTPNSQLQQALERIKSLETQYTDLLEKFEELRQTVGDKAENTTTPAQNVSNSSNILDILLENDRIQAQNISNVRSQAIELRNLTSVNRETILEIQTDEEAQKDDIVGIIHNQAVQNESITLLNSKTSVLDAKVSETQSETQNLEGEVQKLKNNITSQNVKIRQLEDKIEVYRTTLNNNIISYQANVTSRLDSISKMPGPPGAGNLSACEYKDISVGGSSDIPQSQTGFIPVNAMDEKAWVIMGIECSVQGGELAVLDTRNSVGFHQFRCLCSGKSAGTNNRYCYMHYWRCPRIS